jgi:hypothetical protein
MQYTVLQYMTLHTILFNVCRIGGRHIGVRIYDTIFLEMWDHYVEIRLTKLELYNCSLLLFHQLKVLTDLLTKGCYYIHVTSPCRVQLTKLAEEIFNVLIFEKMKFQWSDNLVECIEKGDNLKLDTNKLIYALKLFGQFDYFELVLSKLINQFSNRKAYLSIVEGCKRIDDSHISKYLFDDYIVLNICLLLGPPISFKNTVVNWIIQNAPYITPFK